LAVGPHERKGKIVSALFLAKHHAMKAYGWMEV
jgi:hypothetical protein